MTYSREKMVETEIVVLNSSTIFKTSRTSIIETSPMGTNKQIFQYKITPTYTFHESHTPESQTNIS